MKNKLFFIFCDLSRFVLWNGFAIRDNFAVEAKFVLRGTTVYVSFLIETACEPTHRFLDIDWLKIGRPWAPQLRGRLIFRMIYTGQDKKSQEDIEFVHCNLMPIVTRYSSSVLICWPQHNIDNFCVQENTKRCCRPADSHHNAASTTCLIGPRLYYYNHIINCRNYRCTYISWMQISDISWYFWYIDCI